MKNLSTLLSTIDEKCNFGIADRYSIGKPIGVNSSFPRLPPGSPERDDVYHMYAYKAKLHRVIPESGYTARVSFQDDTPLEGEANYRVRVEQRNGQRAWSSPIWIRKE